MQVGNGASGSEKFAGILADPVPGVQRSREALQILGFAPDRILEKLLRCPLRDEERLLESIVASPVGSTACISRGSGSETERSTASPARILYSRGIEDYCFVN